MMSTSSFRELSALLTTQLAGILRSGTSVGANYRAACRDRSKAEFAEELGIVEEDADESLYWMEILIDAEINPMSRLKDLMTEGEEVLSIIVASIRTTKEER